MGMIVLDVETTGTNPEKNSLLSIGAVEFEKPQNQFYGECKIWEGAHVEDEALVINGQKREQIVDSKRDPEAELVRKFINWTEGCADLVIAGQNVFFDVSFIEAAARRGGIQCSFSQRIIDLHSITFFHMLRRGMSPPLSNRKTNLNSDTILRYVGLPEEPKPHIAINGAIWEAEAFSRLIFDKFLFTRFEENLIPWANSDPFP